MRTYSSAASPATAQSRTRKPRKGRNRRAASVRAASTTPLITRVIARLGSGRLRVLIERSFGARVSHTDAAVAPLALLVREHGLEQVAAPEVRPQCFGDVNLGVRDLPEQVIADAHFAARANQEVGVRLPRGVQETRKALLIQILGTHARLHRAACGID